MAQSYNSPEVQIASVANLFSRQMHFKQAGDCEHGHCHQFDHLTLLASGVLQVVVNGHTTVYRAPTMIYIHADYQHELTALEPDTVAYCIHALRDGNGVDDIVDPQSVPHGVDPLTRPGIKPLTK